MDRRQFLQWLGVAGAGLGTTGLLITGCQPTQPQQSPAVPVAAVPPAPAGAAIKRGGTLVIGADGDVPGVIASRSTGSPEKRVLYAIFEGLVAPDPKTLDPAPALAESWDISSDATVFTFHLRKGVTFHDGTPFDAEAAQFTFEINFDPAHPYFDPVGAGIAKARFGTLTKVEVLDPYTLRVTQSEPRSDFLLQLSDPPAFFTSPAAIKQYGMNEIGNHPVGTGPFRFVEWERGSKLVLERNQSYWGEGPYLDRLIIRPIPEAGARVAGLKSGEVDLIQDVPTDSIPVLQADPNYGVAIGTVGAGLWAFTFNVQEKPFDDQRVRQAVNYAINREALVRDLLKGAGTIATQNMPPGRPEYDPTTIRGYGYDPARAKQLLAEAGYPNGFRTIWQRPSSVLGPTVLAEFIQSNLKDVGIEVEFQNFEAGAYQVMVRSPIPAGIGALNWRVTADVLNFERRYSSKAIPPAGYNFGQYVNPRVDDLFAKARSEPDAKQRSALYKQIDQIVVDDAPLLFVYHHGYSVAYDKRTKGYLPVGAAAIAFFNTVWLD
jgi:peptide/nickel transport system substrate-binding protein